MRRARSGRHQALSFALVGMVGVLAAGAGALGLAQSPSPAPLALRDAAQATLDASSYTVRVTVHARVHPVLPHGAKVDPLYGEVRLDGRSSIVYRAPDRVEEQSQTSAPFIAYAPLSGDLGPATRSLETQVIVAIGSTQYMVTTLSGFGLGRPLGAVLHEDGAAARLVQPEVIALRAAVDATDVRTAGGTYTFTHWFADLPFAFGRSDETVAVADGVVRSITVRSSSGGSDVWRAVFSRVGSSPQVHPPQISGAWLHAPATTAVPRNP